MSSERGGGRRGALAALRSLFGAGMRPSGRARQDPPHAPGTAPIPRPLHCDWAWRPPAWAVPVRSEVIEAPQPGLRFCADLAVFHDCPQRGFALRQVPPAAPGQTQAIEITVRGFAGSFLSLAIDLPAGALAGLGPGHVVTLDLAFAAEVPLGAQARLNLRQGPEHHRLPRPVAAGRGVEFDLGGGRIDGRRIEAAWLDLIFVTPAENRIVISDLTLARRPRAVF